MDLLLHLITKNKLDVTDIPMALVTRQYLEYIELMQALDIVVAGEYLVMAATLMHIKSRMLLPRPEPLSPEDDPRLEIVRPLQELMAVRAAAEQLERRPLLGRDVFTRGRRLEESLAEMGIPVSGAEAEASRPIEASLYDLLDAFRKVLGNRSLPHVLEIARARVSLSERMEELSARLAAAGRLRFFDLFTPEDLQVTIVTFLAILELARLAQIRLLQEVPGGDILILPRAPEPETAEPAAAHGS
ncbi:segregation/condensation protein A [Dissulfurirhabdus thermomarina]|uniref:Segregation and condensation protein A n=1 Tax=Dissulfurirhabdus thermomarina TaxID=1765737 RepID=A0A6N9TLW7_DISTH|nr:segregation/condensation protein A [Dissulfurirhabdus thermomarina]NDY41430.1 segregation/condensation protein A [Dissulfurirhabdus thermomarina]NMX24418.1 segregation/condensation protein A [Dissulfurirhabdus thermomarina]